MIRKRNGSNDEAVEMLNKAKDLMESATEMMETACDMLKHGISERGGMDYRNQMRDSRGRYSGREWDGSDERMMRREGWHEDDMPRGRYDY
jgi:hypothetical protein